jgi:hypothetical protein
MTWPLATDLSHSISDPGDPYFSAWTLHWDWKQTFHDPRHLFDANIFYPARWSLAFSENMWGVSLFGFPLYFAGLQPIEVYNVLFILGIVISGFAAWLFAAEVTGDRVAAIVAGVFYAFVPFRLEHLAHIHMQWGGFIPLFLLFLRRYFQSRRARDLALFSLFFVWNGLVGIQYTAIGAVALTTMILIKTTKLNLWGSIRHWASLAAALAVSGLLLLPFYAPYVHASRRYKLRRHLGEVEFFSARLTSFLDAGGHNKLYGPWTARFDKPECQLFFGIVVPALAIAGLILLYSRRTVIPPTPPRPRSSLLALDVAILLLMATRVILAVVGRIRIDGILSIREPYRLSFLITVAILSRLAISFPAFIRRYRNLGEFVRNGPWSDDVLWVVTLVVLGIVLPLGTHAFPYRELYEIFPFAMRAIRVPARQVVLAHLGLGILATYGVALWRKRSRRNRRTLIPLFCTLAMLGEYRAAPFSYYKADTHRLPLSDWLTHQSFSGSVVELPMKWIDNVEYVYRTTEHGRPIVNGFSSFSPPDFQRLTQSFTANPIAPDAWELLDRDSVHFLVFHPRKATRSEILATTTFLQAGTAAGRLSPTAFFDDDHDKSLVFEVLHDREASSSRTNESAKRNAQARIETYLRHPDMPQRPPVGWYDAPLDNQIFRGASISGSGWAASDSGIARVVIDLDGHPVGDATYGIERHDVPSVKPDIPCGAFCGYRFRIEGVRPGRHTLTVRFIGKDGWEGGPPTTEFQVAK